MPSIHATRGGLRQAARALPILAVFTAVALAQEPPAAMSRPMPAPPSLCAAFDVTAGTVQYVAPFFAENGDVSAELEFAGVQYHLALQPVDVRAPDFKLLVNDATGLHQVPTPPSVTYRGGVLEDPASWVAATIINQSITAIVHLGSGAEWAVQPVASVQRNAGAAVHLVYRSTDNAPLPWGCGTQGSLTGPVAPAIGTDLAYICQIACEADPAYYQLNGSNVTSTQNDITGVINATTVIYQNAVQVSFQITQIIVNVTGSDPYTSSVAGTLLGQFQSNWNNTHGNITRDTAHLFTGRPMGQSSGGAIGIAFLSQVCNLGAAYGVSQSRWTGNFTLRVAVTAHEIGHNFSAQHCDAVPPCYIMCSGVGGCQNVQTTFSQNERNQIINYAQSANCLQIVPNQPVLSSITPTQASAFQPGILQMTGSGFIGTTQVQIGSVVLTSGFSVTSDTAMTVSLPQPAQLGSAPVQVTNASGTSAALPFSYTASSPTVLSVPVAVLGGATLTWNIAGQPSNVWAVLISGVNTTTPFLGWPILDGSDLFAIGFLSPSLGFGSHSVTVPPGLFAGQTVYSQAGELLLGASVLTVVGSSVVKSTLVIN